VVASHYRVNLGAISTGYVIPEGLNDEVKDQMETREGGMNRSR
jgi:hypothetical protein